LPLDLTQYRRLTKILGETYQGSIVYKGHQEGAYDNNWLKEYELFYNKQVGSTPYVRRVFFKTNNVTGKFAGFVDIRPVTDGSEVCESYLIPPESLEAKHAYVKCMRKRNYYGKTFNCAPYIMPDCTFGMCMQTAIWICLKTLEDTVEKPLAVPEIQALAHGTPYADSEGLDFARTARIFRMSKANAIYKNSQRGVLLSDRQMLNELYAYVESYLPVIIGVDTRDLSWWANSSQQGYHVIVAIGHTMSDNNEIDGFVFHDESALPYITLTNNQLLQAWHAPTENLPSEYQHITAPVREMIVAVPPEVTLTYNRAFQQFKQWLSIFIERGLVDFDFNDNLEYRSFLEPILLKDIDKLPLKSLSKSLKELKNLPEFFWFIFIFNKNDSRDSWQNAKGIFIRDATRQTDFRLLYLQKEQTAFYQLSGKVYKRSENIQGKTTLTV
jgi:hypothetical protein